MMILLFSSGEILISEIESILAMFGEFISRILGAEKVSALNRQENIIATPDVIEKSSITNSIPKKYKKDIEALQIKYGDSFSIGFCIEVTLRELLEICSRERRRTDAYTGLVSYLSKEPGIKLTIK